MTEDRPYQPIAAAWLAGRRRGCIVMPARSGKTIAMSMAFKAALDSRKPSRLIRIGWIGNTVEQVAQAYRAMLIVFLGIEVETCDAKARWEAEKHRLTAFSLRCACAAAQLDWSNEDVLVIDEAHTAIAPTHAAQIATCTGRVYGMTATPPEDAEKRAAFLAMFGEMHVVTADQVKAHTAPAIVQWLDDTDPDIEAPITSEIDKEVARRRRWWKGDPGQLWGQVAFQVCARRGVVENQARNAAAIATANGPRSTVVLVGQVDHAETLAGRIGSARAVYAAMGAKARRETLAAFNAGELRCIVGTQLLDEGIDMPSAEVLVLVAGGRKNSRTTQRTARVLTKFQGKEHGLIIDFVDHYHALPAKHARLRSQLYDRLGYKQIDTNRFLIKA